LKVWDAIEKKMKDPELKLVTQSQMLSDDKDHVEGYSLYLNLIGLNGEIGAVAGYVAGTSNYGPTETAIALLDLERQLQAVQRVQEPDGEGSAGI
jgi:hypothetical protein